jgi:hypothetical protein
MARNAGDGRAGGELLKMFQRFNEFNKFKRLEAFNMFGVWCLAFGVE